MQDNNHQAGIKPYLDIIVMQDAGHVQDSYRQLRTVLQTQQIDFRVSNTDHARALMQLLENRHAARLPVPTHLFLDVSDNGGVVAAKEALQFFEQNHPGEPLPDIHFLSLDMNLGIQAAWKLRAQDARINAGAITAYESEWLVDYFRAAAPSQAPMTRTLRDLLNAKFGLDIPTEIMHGAFSDELEKLRNAMTLADIPATNDDLLVLWQQGKVPSEIVIDRMRDYATGVADAISSGFYAASNGKAAGLGADALFYASTGYPVKAPVVFSTGDALRRHYTSQKPILVMRGYDPSVVPLMAQNKIAGLVVTGTYMASHLKMLCETHMITGLFGVIPPEQRHLSAAFTEATTNGLSPFFESSPVEIDGHKIKNEQQILIGLDGNGIVFSPPESLAVESNLDGNIELQKHINNLKIMSQVFDDYFKSKAAKPHMIKANVESGDPRKLTFAHPIGLTRTEQIVAGSGLRLGYLYSGLVEGYAEQVRSLNRSLYEDYQNITSRLRQDVPVKIRLFDFTFEELLNKKQQIEFVKKFGKLSIHGGDALDKWPHLYEGQVEQIFAALNSHRDLFDTPLEIMMPSIKTAADVAKIKGIVTSVAERMNIKPGRYRFGVMIETLEACQNIEAIAKLCDFISFGTNDLTQLHTGIKRADIKAHKAYAEEHGMDPFKVLTPDLYRLVAATTARARAANPHIAVDVCGAQAADPKTAIRLFASGVDNISVAPSTANLHALPLTLNYALYDQARFQAPKNRPPHLGDTP